MNDEVDLISIIIPVLNEEKHIFNLLSHLKESASNQYIKEIILVDGGSTDNTIKIAKKLGVKVVHSTKGRAKQMNFGAQNALGKILYFLHADTYPPSNFDSLIFEARLKGRAVGCFRMRFDSNSWFLSFFAWFSRVNHTICRGGDQSLFIDKEIFISANGFDESYEIYEDNEFIRRISKQHHFTVLPEYVVTSARKYREKGVARLQYYFGVIHLKSILGQARKSLATIIKEKLLPKLAFLIIQQYPFTDPFGECLPIIGI